MRKVPYRSHGHGCKGIRAALMLLMACSVALTSGIRVLSEGEDVSQVTIETKSRAFFVRAEENVVQEIRQWTGTTEAREQGLEQIKKQLSNRYGNRINIDEFYPAELTSIQGVMSVSMTLREATLSGDIPSIEGLTVDEALIVLGTFGFIGTTRRDFNAMSDQDKYRRLYSGRGPMVVIDGTDPLIPVTIYYKESRGEKH